MRELDNDKGDLAWVAHSFLLSDEFRAPYGDPATISNEALLDALYANILDRAPDAGGKAYWLEQLAGGMARQNVLASFSESVANKLLVGIAIENGTTLDAGLW